MPARGWLPVTVAGAPGGWRDLHARFGSLPFGELFVDAIAYAERGYPVSPSVAAAWARAVEGVLATEKLRIRRSGTRYLLELHVQAEPALSLYEAHILSGKVKSRIRSEVPRVANVLVHMEPFEGT